jgi:hypothetical protein
LLQILDQSCTWSSSLAHFRHSLPHRPDPPPTNPREPNKGPPAKQGQDRQLSAFWSPFCTSLLHRGTSQPSTPYALDSASI